MNKEKKVGLFILISLIFFIGLLSYVEIFSQIFSNKYTLNIMIKNSAGLSINSKVKLLGLEIGYVSEITLKKKKILLVLKIDEKIEIPKDSIVFINKTNLLGGKFLNIHPGDSEEILLNNGYLTKVKLFSSISNTTDSANVLFENIGLLVNDIRDIVTKKEKENIKKIINNSERLISYMEKLFRLNETKISNMITNFEKLSKEGLTLTNNANRIMNNADKLINTLDKTVGTFNKKTIKILDKVDNFTEKINSISSILENKLPIFIRKTDKIQDDIQDIVSKNKISDLVLSVDSFFDKSKNMVNKVNKYIDALDRSEIGIEVSTSRYINNNVSFSRGDAKIYYNPNNEKSYILSLSSGPDFSEKNSSTEGFNGVKKHERSKYLLSLEYAYKLDNYIFRGGLMKGTGGVGLDYTFNSQSNFMLTADLYDFNAVNDIRGELPNLTSSLEYKAFNFLKLYIGTNNVLNKDVRNFSFGIGVDFIDKDLKSIFGAIVTSTK